MRHENCYADLPHFTDLGEFGEYDLYRIRDSFGARYGSDGPDYLSMSISCAMRHRGSIETPLAEALKRWEARPCGQSGKVSPA